MTKFISGQTFRWDPLAVMYWRWTRSRRLLWRLRERHREIQKEAANTVAPMLGEPGASAPTMTLVDAARYGDAATVKRVAVATKAARTFPGQTDVIQTLTRQFQTRTQLNTLLDGARALSRFSNAINALSGVTGPTKVGMLADGLVGASVPGRFTTDPPVLPDFGAAKAATAALVLTAPGRFMVRPPSLPDYGAARLVRDAAAPHQLPRLMEPIRRMAELFDTQKLVTAALAGPKLPLFPALDAFSGLLPRVDELRRLDEAMQAAAKLESRFQSRALAYLVMEILGNCTPWEAENLHALTDAEVEEVVLLAVELVVCGGGYIVAVRHELTGSYLLANPITRRQIDHALEHVARGEWGHACDPLYAGGLEGLYSTAAIILQLITPEKTFLGQRKNVTFTNVVKLPIPSQLKTLMNNSMFGGVGNAHRHGEAEDGERRQALLGVVALAGLMEAFDPNCPAFTALAQEAADALTKALKLWQGTLLAEADARPVLDA